MDDLRFAQEEAAFLKSIGGAFSEFSTKVQKIISKQESSRLHSYPTGYVYFHFFFIVLS